MESKTKKAIEQEHLPLVLEYISQIEKDDFSNQEKLDDILYAHLINNNQEFLDKVSSLLAPEQELMLSDMVSDIACNKEYAESDGSKVVSSLYVIPVIAGQDASNKEWELSDEDLNTIKTSIENHIIDSNFKAKVFGTMLTLQAMAKEGVEISQLHDKVVNGEFVSKGQEETFREDRDYFLTKDPTLVVRYILVSFTAPDSDDYIGVEESMKNMDTSKFSVDVEKVIRKYYSDLFMMFSPLPYLDGLELGLFEYNLMSADFYFKTMIESMSDIKSKLGISVDSSEIGVIRINLVDTFENQIIATYPWHVAILSSISLQENVEYVQKLCHQLGFDKYTVDGQNERKKVTIH